MLSIVALCFAAGAGSAWAAPGDLDPSFHGDGKVTTAFFAEADASAAVHAIAVQQGGAIVAAGNASRAGSDSEFALARYNADGSLDASFGSGGKVTTDIAGGQDYAYGVAVQHDGSIVAVGSANVNAASFFTRFTLVRYNDDGSLDTNFGTGGIVSTSFLGNDAATSVALQPDGKIVVAGTASDGSLNRFALARYNFDGSLDASFGSGGKVTTSFFGFYDGASAVALQADGKIVVVGTAYPGGANRQFAVARYNADGSLDATFGVGGKVTTDFFGANDGGHAVVLEGGKIVAAGMAYQGGTGIDEFAFARYNADGSLDPTFGGDGKATLQFSHALTRRLAAAGQADGKIVAVSWGFDGATFDVFSLARFNADGSLDLSFGTNGKVTTNFLGSQNQAHAIAVQADGKIVAAGAAYDPAARHSKFALARYGSGTGPTEPPPPPPPPPSSLSALTLSPTNVTGGNSSTGTVTLTGAAPAGGSLVSLTDNSAATVVPSSVAVAAGSTAATFAVTTGSVTTSTVSTITAAHGGVTRSATLTVNPAAAATAKLTVRATGRSGSSVVSSPAGINVRVGSTGSASFAVNTVITLRVSNDRDAVWSGACSSGGRRAKSCTFSIKGNASVTGDVR